MNSRIPFLIPIQEDIREVEAKMRSQARGHHPDLENAVELILASGGKRLRPALTLLTGLMLGAPRDRLITLSAAIELLHTATLVHDDLIDSSILRRGMPTLNSTWSPGATVLTGDFIFSCAARLASETDSIPVIHLFAKTLSTIVNGEINQLLSSRCQVSRDDYYQRIYAKTASLFETCTKSAALASDASEPVVESMRQYGHEIGMAFQMVDDILDFTGDPSELGKPVGSDLRQGLVTLPSLYYIEKHPNDPDVQALISGECVENDEQTQRLVQSIRSSDAIQLSKEEACTFARRAVVHLEKQPAGVMRDSLEQLAMYIVERQV